MVRVLTLPTTTMLVITPLVLLAAQVPLEEVLVADPLELADAQVAADTRMVDEDSLERVYSLVFKV